MRMSRRPSESSDARSPNASGYFWRSAKIRNIAATAAPTRWPAAFIEKRIGKNAPSASGRVMSAGSEGARLRRSRLRGALVHDWSHEPWRNSAPDSCVLKRPSLRSAAWGDALKDQARDHLRDLPGTQPALGPVPL